MHVELTTKRIAVFAAMLALLPSAIAFQSNRKPSNAVEYGYEKGYRDGYDFGRNSQASNREQDIVNQKLRAADREYESSYGPMEEYRQGYTDGFRSGLDDARSQKPSRMGHLFPSESPNASGQDMRRDDRISGIPPVRPSSIGSNPPIDRGAAPRNSATGHGMEHGYREGYAFGRSSQASNRDQDILNQKLRNADRDYVEAFGAREEYRQGYMDGFRMGLEDARGNLRSRLPEIISRGRAIEGSRQSSRTWDETDYGAAGWPLDHIANDVGYRDGMNDAIQDANARRSIPVRRHTAWRTALHGFKPSMGAQENYKRQYRIAYEAGYADGYLR